MSGLDKPVFILFPELTNYVLIGLVLCLSVIGIRELLKWLKKRKIIKF